MAYSQYPCVVVAYKTLLHGQPTRVPKDCMYVYSRLNLIDTQDTQCNLYI